MATITQQQVRVSMNVLTMSVNYMVNTVMQLMLRIIKERGLSPKELIRDRDLLEDGLSTWLREQTLESLHVEVVSRRGEKALEIWTTVLEYRAEPDLQVRKPPVDQLATLCKKLRSLPSGTRYRILVSLRPGATEVPGWVDAEFRPFTQAREETLSGWGYGHIGGKLVYREGVW